MTDTMRVGAESIHLCTFRISEALAPENGPGPGRTVVAPALSESMTGRGAAPAGTIPEAARRP
ncbi:hypothetical protein G6021_03055 [Dietzia sp. CW19]|nr:hypothetical protein [Dietzia sp. CW19]